MRILSGLWLVLWSLPTLLLSVLLVLALPMAVFALLGLQALVLIIAALGALCALVLWLVCLLGWLRGWYLSWVVAMMGAYLSVFVLGLVLAAAVFNLPFDASGALSLVALFVLLNLGLRVQVKLQSQDMRDAYAVEQHIS
ncbi:hypothetical protein [Agaribacterium sp. ZY112]|uniref:hypothetical protein n=1 Tax=Agaribacterium sp. ZY112 TaxID=3233574 RepID=UPI003523951F